MYLERCSIFQGFSFQNPMTYDKINPAFTGGGFRAEPSKEN